jgi:pyridoxal phosphate enzyme (YggS family)
MNNVAANIASVRKKMAAAALACEREPGDVRLIAVSKMQPEEKIEAALAAGQRIFGENRVQEAKMRWAERSLRYPDLSLHLIGPLQTNKVRDAVMLFDVIETVDRPEIAEKLAAEMARQARDLPCFIQVNTGEEPQKAGVLPDYTAEFHDYCRYECGLDICGLMCIPPVDEAPEVHFELLQELARLLDLPHLSMGMSSDFEKAIPYGATLVRVGTGVFGARE